MLWWQLAVVLALSASPCAMCEQFRRRRRKQTVPGSSDAIVHLFEWKWTDVAEECEQYLAPMGFAAVQTSPQMEHIQGPQWWTRYQPVSYADQSRSGTSEEFQDMVRRCGKVGVAIIADPVPNHMAAGEGTGTAGSSFGQRAYPSAGYGAEHFHHNPGDEGSNCEVTDYNDLTNVQTCDLVGLPDLDTGSAFVQGQLASYFNRLLSYGVAGFRIDAAKHQNDQDIAAYLRLVGNGGTWVFQEVIYGYNEAVQPEMYTHNGRVTEFRWTDRVSNAFKSRELGALSGIGQGTMASDDSVVFLDNHDTQRDGAPLTYKDGDLYRLAVHFMLAHPFGLPRLMSSYDFTDHDQGPPAAPVHGPGDSIRCGAGQPWVCEHRWQGVGEMVGLRRCAGDEPVRALSAQGGAVWFARGTKAFIAINTGGQSLSQQSVATGLPGGRYCDVSKGLGQCHEVMVNSDGTLDLALGSMDSLAVHVCAKAPSPSAPYSLSSESISGSQKLEKPSDEPETAEV